MAFEKCSQWHSYTETHVNEMYAPVRTERSCTELQHLAIMREDNEYAALMHTSLSATAFITRLVVACNMQLNVYS